MNVRPRFPTQRASTLLAATCALLFAITAFPNAASATATLIPDYPTRTYNPWQQPDAPKVKPVDDAARAGQIEGTVKGATAALGKAGQVADLASKALDFNKSLNASDDRLKANYEPEGSPSVPSKCMENAACRPCYTEAYGKINKTRIALEKVRAHYDFTHKFSADGIAVMNGVAATAGGPAGIGAAVESRKVNAAVAEFDTAVRNKNQELLARLKGELMEVNTCESKYYGSNDWYDRFGYMYFQFMSAHYGYAVSHSK
ncbi:MAG: hypothetical protein ABIP44_10990 [Pseudoxanthomonas sp.]